MSNVWKSDQELFAIARRELYTAVVGDIMDTLGLRQQFLPPGIRPLHPDMVVVGRAMTVLEADLPPDNRKGKRNKRTTWVPKPFGLMFDALDDLQRDEVYLCTGASPNYALWGELMSCRAIRCGAAGVILNGYTRDARGILALRFPTFSLGSYAQDQAPRGHVLDFRVRVKIRETTVNPGDIVFGDIDGVCVVPKAAEKEVFIKALEKARGEKRVMKAIQKGMKAGEAFAQYGIM